MLASTLTADLAALAVLVGDQRCAISRTDNKDTISAGIMTQPHLTLAISSARAVVAVKLLPPTTLARRWRWRGCWALRWKRRKRRKIQKTQQTRPGSNAMSTTAATSVTVTEGEAVETTATGTSIAMAATTLSSLAAASAAACHNYFATTTTLLAQSNNSDCHVRRPLTVIANTSATTIKAAGIAKTTASVTATVQSGIGKAIAATTTTTTTTTSVTAALERTKAALRAEMSAQIAAEAGEEKQTKTATARTPPTDINSISQKSSSNNCSNSRNNSNSNRAQQQRLSALRIRNQTERQRNFYNLIEFEASQITTPAAAAAITSSATTLLPQAAASARRKSMRCIGDTAAPATTTPVEHNGNGPATSRIGKVFASDLLTLLLGALALHAAALNCSREPLLVAGAIVSTTAIVPAAPQQFYNFDESDHSSSNSSNNASNDSLYDRYSPRNFNNQLLSLDLDVEVMNASSYRGSPSNDNTLNTLKSLSIIEARTEAFEEVNRLPIFDFGMPRNITARTGQTEATIKCRVGRLDDKSVSWIRKRDLHILTVGTATYTSDKRFQVTASKNAREWTLHVKSPQTRDGGIYECQVNTEPKMSMAFQLNIIEIPADSRAIISGPPDLHFKVGSAIILNCHVQQPSSKDIGPIYWYRGEHIITPFDVNEADDILTLPTLPAAMAAPALAATVAIAAADTNAPLAVTVTQHDGLTNDITPDFTARIAMESQLGDTLKSRLRISNARTSDTGNYTCQPTTASSASVMVHVINDENPAAMQKSSANTLHRGWCGWCGWCRPGLLIAAARRIKTSATAKITAAVRTIMMQKSVMTTTTQTIAASPMPTAITTSMTIAVAVVVMSVAYALPHRCRSAGNQQCQRQQQWPHHHYQQHERAHRSVCPLRLHWIHHWHRCAQLPCAALIAGAATVSVAVVVAVAVAGIVKLTNIVAVGGAHVMATTTHATAVAAAPQLPRTATAFTLLPPCQLRPPLLGCQKSGSCSTKLIIRSCEA